MNLKKLRVVIFQEGEWLCAHGLEFDFATQAKTLDALRSFKNERRAPKRYWTLFERSKIALPPQSFGLKLRRRGVKIPTPEIRVATLTL